MANKIQILRNSAIATNRVAAKTALLAQLSKDSMLDGEIAICRYQAGSTDSDKAVKVLLGFNNTVGEGTKQFIFDADAIPADVQTELDKITGDSGTITKLKEEIIGKNTDTKDSNTVYGAKAYAKDYTDSKVASLDVTDSVTSGSVVVAVSETDGKVSSTKATITSSDKTVKVSSDNKGNITLDANIDGKTIVKDATSGALSVASSALTQYVGSNAIAVSGADASNNKTISLGINTNDKVLSQSTSGLLASLSLNYSSNDKTITLVGKDSTVISTITTNDFVKDGMLNDAKAFLASGTSQEVTFKGGKHTFNGLTKGNHYIGFEFKTSDGTTSGTTYTYDNLDATTIIDVYVAGNGIALTDHTFSVKKDTTSTDSENFLSVSESGVKVSGVQAAIDKAKAAATTVVVHKDGDAHVKVSSSTATDGHTLYTVESVNTASATDLTTEVTRAKGAEDKIEASVGLAADGSHVTTTGNYTSKATTIAGEISALDTQVKANEDAIDALEAAKVSVSASTDTESAKYLEVSANDANTVYTVKAKGISSAISTAIANLDVTAVGGTGKVITTVSETDGKISATAIDLKAANVAATATAATNDKVAVTGTTVEAQIASLATSIAKIDCGTY